VNFEGIRPIGFKTEDKSKKNKKIKGLVNMRRIQ
jgi:hypothetical protein